jgi:MoaA/NifB/PqqE/SkfB family radical SAM enzyme
MQKWDYMSPKRYLKHVLLIDFKRQPTLLFRTLKGYFRTIILKKRTLRSVEFAVTYRCQLSCPKCFAAKFSDSNRKELSVSQIAGIWKQCLALGAIHVNITGGEPLLRSDIYDVIKAFQPHRTFISLVTNSLLLNEERLKELKKAGLSYLQISLDSYLKELHDKLRGSPGCYDKVISGATLAKKIGLHVSFTTVATHQNVRTSEIPEMLKISEKLGVFLLINFAGRSGNWSGKDDMLLTREDRLVLNEYMKHPLARLCEMINFYNIPGLCLAGKDKLNISAYGDVYPCTHIHISFGNALSESIKDIYEKIASFSYFKGFATDCIRYEYLNPVDASQITPVPVGKLEGK